MRLEKGSSGVYPALARHTSANHTNRERRFRSTSRMAMQTTDVSPHPSSRYDIQYIFFTPVIWQRYNWIVSSLFISYIHMIREITNVYMYVYIEICTRSIGIQLERIVKALAGLPGERLEGWIAFRLSN